ncbi:MAG TPA: hypothetical protein VNL14_13995 [Candidatus Acidoferrales bacterium]|nr:hypothetical protein [Candidatus Acidoferrales bacterium]
MNVEELQKISERLGVAVKRLATVTSLTPHNDRMTKYGTEQRGLKNIKERIMQLVAFLLTLFLISLAEAQTDPRPHSIWVSPWTGKTHYQCIDSHGQLMMRDSLLECPTEAEGQEIRKRLKHEADARRVAEEERQRAAAEQERIDRARAAADPCSTIDHSALRPLIHREANGGRYIYVTRRWYFIPIDNKQSLAAYLARCRSVAGWVEIYDAYNGKKLAKYGSWGYSNYEN